MSEKANLHSAEWQVFQAGYNSEEDLSAEPQFNLLAQTVELQVQPAADAALTTLWKDAGESRSRTMPSAEVSATMQSLIRQGVAKIVVHPARPLLNGREHAWHDGGRVSWIITASNLDQNTVDISLAGLSWHVSPDAQFPDAWNTKAESQLSYGTTLVVEGPTVYTPVTEISRQPIVGDIPFVGPKLFSSKQTTFDSTKTLYLFAIETASSE